MTDETPNRKPEEDVEGHYRFREPAEDTEAHIRMHNPPQDNAEDVEAHHLSQSEPAEKKFSPSEKKF